MTQALPPESGARFSPDRVYRYTLWRRWDERPATVFVLLNPSTADELVNDPTIERCERRVRGWNDSGGLTVVNLFAYRSTDPAALKTVDDAVGPDNDREIRARAIAPRRKRR